MKHSASFEQITPEMAGQLLLYNSSNRPPSTSHISYLADEIRQGRFMPTAAIHIAYDVDGGATLINGQQTLMAIQKANKTIALNVVRTTNCTQDEQIMLYIQTDIPRKRSFADTASAYHLSEKMHVRPRVVNKIAGALRFMWTGFGINVTTRSNERLPDAILFNHVPRWEEEARLLLHAISGCSEEMNHLLDKAPVYSVALITAFYKPKQAKEFWSQVALNDGLGIGDPRKTLHEYLRKTKSVPGTQSIPRNVLARGVSNCWNAFYEDRLLHVVMVQERAARAPIGLKGTSYSGNQALNYYPHRDPNHNGKPSTDKQQLLISSN